MVSCEKNRNDDQIQKEKVQKLLEIEARMNALNSGAGLATNFMSVIGYSQFKDGSLSINGSGSGAAPGDSVYSDSSIYWEPVTCAKVTELDNEDGTHTTIFDYGDGCSEYGSLTKGRIIYIWKNDNNSYISEVVYDNYYSFGMLMNGISKYTFTSDGESYYKYGDDENNDSTITIMPVIFNWSGSSTGRDDISMKYDDGNTVIFKSSYSNEWDSVSYKVTEGDYFYSSTTEDYEYHYTVTEPLLTDYTCTDTWVPVKGIETITTLEKGVESVYALDYGNGACDNLAKLTENGKTSVIDFGEIFTIVEPNSGKVTPAALRNGKK
jgi:hypothetical protein